MPGRSPRPAAAVQHHEFDLSSHTGDCRTDNADDIRIATRATMDAEHQAVEANAAVRDYSSMDGCLAKVGFAISAHGNSFAEDGAELVHNPYQSEENEGDVDDGGSSQYGSDDSPEDYIYMEDDGASFDDDVWEEELQGAPWHFCKTHSRRMV